jgi:hypothetical protein
VPIPREFIWKLPPVDTDVIDPPSVMVPVVVIVPPVSVKPFIDPDVATLVTVPVFAVAPVATPSSFVLSAEDMLPAASVVAALIEIAGVVPPELTMGAVPVTDVTPPPEPVDAAVKRPCASTVILAFVYEPAVTAVLARLSVRATDPSKVVPDV